MADNDDNKPNPAEAFQKLLAKNNNDGIQLASQLFDENFQLREKNRGLAKTQPAAGSVVLSGDDAKRFQAFQDLGKEPADIKTALDAATELETENKKLTKRDSLRSVAATGWDLEMLEENVSSKFPEAVFTVKKVKGADGKETETSFITIDGKESSLEEFGKEKFPKLLPVLKVEEAQITRIPGNPPNPPPAGPGSDTEADKAAQNNQARATHSFF